MGKRHFKGAQKSTDKRRRQEKSNDWRNTSSNNTLQMSNDRIVAFYYAQGFIQSEVDLKKFNETLVKPLPACFRINPDYPFADDLRKQLLSFAGETMALENGTLIPAVEQIKWYPGGNGYKLGTDRRQIRKLGALHELHQWMIRHTDTGNITRQEAVSMVPPLALNVLPHHRCLDMCAAPGSKTSQLLEIVNRSLNDPVEDQGLVVANDADTDRAYMLAHQCKRINSPLLIITTHKGQNFPTIQDTFSRIAVKKAERVHSSEFFDRVLCDVPCTGDGTLRKNPAIWSKWNTGSSVTLHPLQILIAQRGLQLLKTEGLMVYSTCSMSPYENEAVVAELLRSAKGTLELVDAREFLPLFNARPGMSHWYVLDDYMAIRKESQTRKKLKRDEKLAEKRLAFEATSSAVKKVGIDIIGSDVGNDLDGNDSDSGENNDKIIDGDEMLGTHYGNSNAEKDEDMSKLEPVGCDNQSYIDISTIENEHLRRCIEMGMTYYPSYQDVPQHLSKKTRKSIFPPSAEEVEWMKLEKCLRCAPQDEDTGGFFVATFRKKLAPNLLNAKLADSKFEVANSGVASLGDTHQNLDNLADNSVILNDNKINQLDPLLAQHKGLVDFHQWDISAFMKIKEFYGLNDFIKPENMFVREDFATSKNSVDKGASKKAGTTSKSVYFIPYSCGMLMNGDRESRLKIVTAGVKMFERKINHNGESEYRLLQDGIHIFAPHANRRKVYATIQDFCNILGGGLVSYTTLSPMLVMALQDSTIIPGVVICCYEYHPRDIVEDGQSEPELNNNRNSTAKNIKADRNDKDLQSSNDLKSVPSHEFYVICWKGYQKTLNVMCGKTDIEDMKHQLEALKVLRPKIISTVRKEALGLDNDSNRLTSVIVNQDVPVSMEENA
eukprot:gene12391-16619_t